MQRQLIDLNSFHETERQTAVVQEEAGKFFGFATKPISMKSASGSGLLILKRVSECDNEKSKSHDLISRATLCGFH